MHSIQGIIIDPVNRRQFPGNIQIEDGIIKEITELDQLPDSARYILPGFVDAHIHIESSMLVPSEFARLAVRHGTVATVSDPHEIANVCGIEGVEFMIENGKKVPLKFNFGAPSCVPATPFETAGAELDTKAVEKLLERDEIKYLAEMMNWPGVLNDDPTVMAKIAAARKHGKPVDGHAPGLKGKQAEKYAAAGISTDHECFTIEEGRDKLKTGMKIAIREGSAAKNYNALIPLLKEAPDRIMFCSDDKHPDDLLLSHINELAARTLKLDYDLFDTLRACSVHAVEHYNLDVGLLQPGDPADFVITNSIESMEISETWINGECVYRDGNVLFDRIDFEPINNFVRNDTTPSDFNIRADGDQKEIDVQVIVAEDGELITGKETVSLPVVNRNILSDQDRDILKIAIINRYQKSKPAVGFIKNFGIKNGAIASSVAHDSHNIIAVGSSDEWLSRVVNEVMKSEGGIAVAGENGTNCVALQVAGIMSDKPGEVIGKAYYELSEMAKKLGSGLSAPFMTISFMALLVIPSLKMSDKGLFDGENFEFVEF